MRKLFLLAVVPLMLSASSPVLAAGYGAAGCGFGSVVIQENKMLHQIGAWFLNGISGNQTFGITSGTSNCSSGGMNMSQREQQQFADFNFDSLAKEMASGQGEDLMTLAGMLGCPAEQSTQFGEFTQKYYTAIFKSDETSSTEMLAALKEGMQHDEALASSCQLL